MSPKKFVFTAIIYITIFSIIILFIVNFIFINEEDCGASIKQIKIESILSAISSKDPGRSPFEKSEKITAFAQKYISGWNKFLTNIYRLIIKNFVKKIGDKFSNIVIEKNTKNYMKHYYKVRGYKANFAVNPIHSIFKLEKENSNLPYPNKYLNLYAVRREWVSFQVIITPFKEKIKDIAAEISGLPINSENIECFQGEYVYCKKPYYPTERIGYYADPLIPLTLTSADSSKFIFITKEYPFNVKIGESKSIWFNIYIPENIQSGDYKLQINISTDKNTLLKSEICQNTIIHLHIYDYTLPKTFHLKNAFNFSLENIYKNYYDLYKFYPYDSGVDFETRQRIYKFFLSYHLNPTHIWGDEYPPLEEWKWCIENGANAFNLFYLHQIWDNEDSDDVKQRKIKDFMQMFAHKLLYLKEHNLTDYAYIFAFDEMHPPHYYKFILTHPIVREIDNSIPIVCTVAPTESLFGLVDIWCVSPQNFDENIAQQRRQAGDDFWFYLLNLTNHPYPNFLIDYPAIDSRIVFWLASKYDISGFLYWETIQWYSNFLYKSPDNKHLRNTTILHEDSTILKKLAKGFRWPDIPWNCYTYMRYNGDGQLLYPWKNGQLIPSIRLINIRDGIEDYECFYQLKQLKKRFENRKEIEQHLSAISQIDASLQKAYSIVPAPNNYEKNPEKLLNIQKELGYLLEEFD